MNAILQWIDQNPASFKGFLATFLAALLKLILQFTGDSAALAQYNAVISQILDLVIALVGFYFLGAGIVHARRGPALTSVDQAAAIVSLLQPAPAAAAVEQVKAVVTEVAAIKPVPAESRRF